MGVNASPAQLPISPSLLTLLSYIYIFQLLPLMSHLHTASNPTMHGCSTWMHFFIFNCSPLTLSFEKPCTYSHAVHPFSSPISLTYFPSPAVVGTTSHRVPAHNFHFRAKNWSGRRIIFLLAFEFCQNRVSDVSGQQLIATQTKEAL